jgi:hypothetical protein
VTFAGDRKHRKLWCQLLAPALGAFGLFAAIDDGLKFVIASFANVLKNRHDKLQ